MATKQMNAATLPYAPCRVEYSVDNSPYDNLYIDITMRCDMDCNYCYNPARSKSDMDIRYYEEVCRRLTRPTYVRLLGGEPTLHPQFLDFINIAKQHNHSVFFASNGLRYNNQTFMKKLQETQKTSPFVAGISMDGGTTNDKFYHVMNNRYCLDKKLEAVENLVKFGIKRVALSAIIVRGYNEQVIGELIALANRYPDNIKYIHFRSAVMTGRWADTEPYTQADLRQLMEAHYPQDILVQKNILQEIHCTQEEGGDCCFRFRANRRLQISLIEFASEKSQYCPKRGKLLPEGFKIQPFYENMVKVGNLLAAEYGEVENIIPDKISTQSS